MVARLRLTTAEAMAHVDLLVVVPIEAADGIRVPDDEDPRLRVAMGARLLDLCDDDELSVRWVGSWRSGHPQQRLDQVLTAIEGSSGRDA